MDRRSFTKAALCTPAWLAAQDSPYDAGDRAQLFVDDVLIRETRAVAFTQHLAEKHPANPLVKVDRPWEGWRLELYGNVLFDEEEKLFKMWYIAEGGGHFRGPYNTHYATSRDGIKWEKPLIGPLRTNSGEATNALVEQQHLPCVMKDNRDPDPSRRYKMIGWIDNPKEVRGYHTMISPDGIHWKPFSQSPIAPSADVITGYYDEQRKLYVAMPKIGTAVRGTRRRVFYSITSEDFVNWTKPKPAFFPDLRDDAGSLARIEESRRLLDVPDNLALMRTEFYGVGFHLAESCTIGFPWVFTINNNARYGNHEGPFELQMAVTRDLETWHRPFRVPCLAMGKPGAWDEGLVVTQSRALRVGDEVWLYYGGANYTHGTPCLYRDIGRLTKHTGSIGLAKWKVDRFVSADGMSAESMLQTVPVAFSGDRLEINADVSRNGQLTVEPLDAALRPIAGFGPSEPVRGDNLRATVSWKRGDIASLKGKPVALRFKLNGAKLFSFAFRKRA